MLGAALCLLALAGCSGCSGGERVAVPRPTAAQAALCGALHRRLPARVDGARRGTARPVSDLTAVWGSPAIVLRCGVPRPAELTPGNRDYDPTALGVQVDGVGWLPHKLSGGGVRCVTTSRKAFVEVTLPSRYTGRYEDISGLADLSSAIRRSIPATLD